MKNLLFILLGGLLVFSSCNAKSQKNGKISETEQGSVLVMTNEIFKQEVFNYEINKSWKFQGDKPVIIDFYADWCKPCKALSPKIEEIAKEYEGKITVYKVNTDKEKDLAQSLGIRSLPTLIFIPTKGQPQATMGDLPKEDIVKIINDYILVN
ncbi:MAG: thioredoxin [Bacteroidales bacterium]